MINLPGKATAPTFNTPLDMLQACHGRIMDQCATLQKLKQHLTVHGSDVQAKQAAQAIVRYFDTAGQFHHQDEELDLFPPLLATRNAEADALVSRLLNDHQIMNKAWLALRSQLHGITEDRTSVLDDAVVENFITAYEVHIVLENTQLLPLAAKLLDSRQIHDLGEKMAARRGVSLSPA